MTHPYFAKIGLLTGLSALIPFQAQAFGAKPPSQPAPPAPSPVPAPPPPVVERGFYEGPFVQPVASNFRLQTEDSARITPACLRRKGIELIVLDPGHDDSSGSRRSDAKVRGGNGKYVFLWPEVHEGHLNQVTSWLAYEMMLADPRLTLSEREELSTMVRFTRHPGETQFGQYEKDLGYSSSTQGKIDSSVGNRQTRVNHMIRNHRKYDRSRPHGFASSTSNVSSKSVLISVHANSSEYFGDGDYSWVIPQKGLSSSHPSRGFQRDMVRGLSSALSDYYEGDRTDTSQVRNLKNAVLPTVAESRILTRDHSSNLAMLSNNIGGSSLPKVLMEGFVMNGKAGQLAHQELTSSSPMKLSFRRSGKTVATYGLSSVYEAYARSLVQGIDEAYGCD